MPSKRSMRQPGIYISLAVITLVLIGADLLYFNSLGEPRREIQTQQAAQETPQTTTSETQPAAECNYNSEVAPVEDYRQFITFSDPMKGNAESSVTVIEFFDPNCGHCRIFHPSMKKIMEANGEKAQFYIRPFVLNPRSQSLTQVEALYAAAEEGKYFEMLDAQFAQAQAGGLSLQQLKTIAKEIGMNGERMEQQVVTGRYREQILKLRQQIVDAGIHSVPTVMINGRVIASSSRTPECIAQFIDEAAKS
jgi:protein-disulfide isomerase